MATKISLPELKTLCKENNIKGYSKLKKDEIIELLKSNKINIDHSSKREDLDEISNDLKNLKVETNIKSEKIENKKSNNKSISSEKHKDETKKEIDESMKKPLTKYYTFKDDKSEKFWEIKYDNIEEEKIKYIVRYGKVDTPGSRANPKLDTLANINKLIASKTKKGYVYQN